MTQSLSAKVLAELEQLSDPAKVAVFQRFFKTSPGQYGEGDQFLGLAVPIQRHLAKRYQQQATLADCAELLASPWHEARLVALMLLIGSYAATPSEPERAAIIDLYQASFDRINKWDLVDLSAPKLTGPWYLGRDRGPLFDWARSDHLWTRRIAVLSSFAFIRAGDASTTLELADILLRDRHDLMQKAVGWMLREVGNRQGSVEREWLAAPAPGGAIPRFKLMGRTMLRYAIEKFPAEEYQRWLKG